MNVGDNGAPVGSVSDGKALGENPAGTLSPADDRAMTSDYAALRRAAASLKRAAKATEAVDSDMVAWQLIQYAIGEATSELERIDRDGQTYALPDSLSIDGEPLRFG